MQAKVRQLGRNPSPSAQQAIESGREQLTVLLHDIRSLMHDAGVVEVKGTTNPGHELLAIWDDVMNEPVLAGPDELPDPAEDTIDPP